MAFTVNSCCVLVILILVVIQARVCSQQMTSAASGLLKSLYRDSIIYIICVMRKPFHYCIQMIANDYLCDTVVSIANVVLMSTISVSDQIFLLVWRLRTSNKTGTLQSTL
jgi:hypothetical protein